MKGIGEDDLVLIHDGVRPFVPMDLLQRAASAADEFGAAIVAVPVKDTVKIARDGVITATPGRPSRRANRPSSATALGRMSLMFATTGSGSASSATRSRIALRSSMSNRRNSPVLPRARMPSMPRALSQATWPASAFFRMRPAESVGR